MADVFQAQIEMAQLTGFDIRIGDFVDSVKAADGKKIEIYKSMTGLILQDEKDVYAVNFIELVRSMQRHQRMDTPSDFSDATQSAVLYCPIPAGCSENELGQNCDQCKKEDPLRADCCRQTWPHHWEGTIDAPEER